MVRVTKPGGKIILTGCLSGEKVVVPKSYREKNQQFKMMMWHKSASKDFKKPPPSLDEFDS